ncbi:MAG: hypothetical protein WCF91_00560 [bacterium]|jgi:hypothetical protein
MSNKLLIWDIYEITSTNSIQGIMLRGRIRKFGEDNHLNILVENAEDNPNSVRFAVLNKKNADQVINYIQSIVNDSQINLILNSVQNPVLSKIKVNYSERYTL